MFEYKFVRIKKNNTGFLQVPTENYQEIIHTHAAEGWRFVQFVIMPSAQAVGFPEYYELIFEKKTE